MLLKFENLIKGLFLNCIVPNDNNNLVDLNLMPFDRVLLIDNPTNKAIYYNANNFNLSLADHAEVVGDFIRINDVGIVNTPSYKINRQRLSKLYSKQSYNVKDLIWFATMSVKDIMKPENYKNSDVDVQLLDKFYNLLNNGTENEWCSAVSNITSNPSDDLVLSDIKSDLSSNIFVVKGVTYSLCFILKHLYFNDVLEDRDGDILYLSKYLEFIANIENNKHNLLRSNIDLLNDNLNTILNVLRLIYLSTNRVDSILSYNKTIRLIFLSGTAIESSFQKIQDNLNSIVDIVSYSTGINYWNINNKEMEEKYWSLHHRVYIDDLLPTLEEFRTIISTIKDLPLELFINLDSALPLLRDKNKDNLLLLHIIDKIQDVIGSVYHKINEYFINIDRQDNYNISLIVYGNNYRHILPMTNDNTYMARNSSSTLTSKNYKISTYWEELWTEFFNINEGFHTLCHINSDFSDWYSGIINVSSHNKITHTLDNIRLNTEKMFYILQYITINNFSISSYVYNKISYRHFHDDYINDKDIKYLNFLANKEDYLKMFMILINTCINISNLINYFYSNEILDESQNAKSTSVSDYIDFIKLKYSQLRFNRTPEDYIVGIDKNDREKILFNNFPINDLISINNIEKELFNRHTFNLKKNINSDNDRFKVISSKFKIMSLDNTVTFNPTEDLDALVLLDESMRSSLTNFPKNAYEINPFEFDFNKILNYIDITAFSRNIELQISRDAIFSEKIIDFTLDEFKNQLDLSSKLKPNTNTIDNNINNISFE